MEDFYKLTEDLWRIYFTGTQAEEEELFETWIDPNCTIIGTGKHEIYHNIAEFTSALYGEIEERSNILFQFQDFWCEPVMLNQDTCLVYGEVHISWESLEQNMAVDMDSRFTLIYQQKEGHWKVVHIHLSLPDLEQAEGEYYPKTLLEQFHQNFEKMEYLQTLAERDGLTNLINFRTFQNRFQSYVKKHGSCWIFLIDVDKFKEVNDTFGHIAGNHVLQKISSALTELVRSSDLVCRMGGDEFILLCSGFDSDATAEAFANRVKNGVKDAGRGEPVWADISIGRARVSSAEDLEDVIKLADSALYEDKRHEFL